MNGKRMCGLLAVWMMGLPAVSMADVFINEIHYDNAGADVGEAIEVVATAGEDLSQYRLHFYNGSNGALSGSTSPAIQSLPAGSPGTCGGTVSISVLYPNQIENGAPDGVALEGPGGTLVQFLSWEGAFTGTAGIANGVASTDISVSESTSAPVGTSLQLGGGPGGSYADFAWNASAAQTFGTCNTGQSFGPAVDIPPYLADSFPENGDTDFPANASLILTFSEPVDVDGTWFEIQCAASGYYTPSNTTVTGDPTVHYLTPNTPFLADDDCELTLDTALITDRGSQAYELDDPGTIAFATVAPPPNEAPELVSTVPLQGTSNFPSAGDLRAVFNEPVTPVAGAFTLGSVN